VIKVREVECKTLLTKSGLADYTINCYTGCEHGCRYCYARFMMKFIQHQRKSPPVEAEGNASSFPKGQSPMTQVSTRGAGFTGHTEEWGSFVDVKVNGPEVLFSQIKKAKIGSVFVSSVCDAWQPLEKRYQLTRRCIEILLRYQFPITILTKSSLIERDMDLLSDGKVDLGVTITTLNEDLRKVFEPKAPSSGQRLKVLEMAKKKGINSYVFLGPLIPYFSDTEEELSKTIKEIADLKPDYIYVDRLNLRWGVWDSLREAIKVYINTKNPPSPPFAKGGMGGLGGELMERYRKILFEQRWSNGYSRDIRKRVIRVAGRYRLNGRLRFCF
jgi:DNA repair photolyase